MITLSRLFNFKLARCVQPLRTNTQYKSKFYMKNEELQPKNQFEQLIKKYASRLIYNTFVEKRMVKLENQLRNKKSKHVEAEPLPITLRYLSDEIPIKDNEQSIIKETQEVGVGLVHFPYDTGIPVQDSKAPPRQRPDGVDIASEASAEVQKRYELQKDMQNWMQSYDNFDDSELPDEVDTWRINYGTPNLNSRISNVPCGGCGARLHCKDTAIPGYIPSEIFQNSLAKGGSNLEAVICQRCHFLKNYNVALQVQVNPEDYPKVLHTISLRQGMVILMVDLVDFPCSIWPGIGDIFGSGIPIVIVGNKVDLLPQDSKDFLRNIKKVLVDTVKVQGFASFNIKDVALISATTGYGVEDLITKLNNLRLMGGDVYIVGCTNVGKSSLFNAFLQSDFCKNQAHNLIQRATTSVWPGTTLNLLKFPIKRPRGHHQYFRQKRLAMLAEKQVEEDNLRREQLKKTKNPKYASLIGHIDVTKNPYSTPTQTPGSDAFIIRAKADDPGIFRMGINERSKEFADSRWCYDTPGVVQPDQLIHLLTSEELLLTLPKSLIVPRTYCLQPQNSLFIAGLARIDYLEGPGSTKLTVFASSKLPITVCNLDDAEELYKELLGTELFKVPMGDQSRLATWPKLEMAKKFGFEGLRWQQSVIDVVLSSAGWVALTGEKGLKYEFQAWTPEKRGVYLRDCILPHAVGLMGDRIKKSVAYHDYKFYVRK